MSASRSANLSREEKLALLASRLALAPGDGDGCPLTSAQARLWFLHELEPQSTSYNICRSLELDGELHVPALEQALSEIVRRHAPLRTTFESLDRQPRQRIGPAWRVSLAVLDLSRLPPDEISERRRRAVLDEARRPFDLGRQPPLRLSLLRLGPRQHVLTLCVHHIAADGWSLGVLFEELAVLYAAALQGEEPRLPALSFQYADYGAWQRTRSAGGALTPLLRYWKEQLAGAPPLLDLAPGRARPELGGNRGARCARTLPPALAQALETLAQSERATPFMALLAGFSALLQRVTGQRDVVVGTPVANRARAELAFDVAAEELFPTWLAGGTVVLTPPPDPPLPQDLGRLVAAEGLTVLNLPAPYWHQWVDALPDPLAEGLGRLRLVVVGSDRVAPERLARWRRLVGSRVEWRNAYGLTESTITATLFAPPESWPADDGGAVPIGRPLAGTAAYVLDDGLAPVPPGVPGELFIGGEGLARGYVRRPELTAAAFLPDPFSPQAGARMYRTGDRALWRADGALQLLGRNDQQLKLRG